MEIKKINVCFTSSSGGHFEQLLMLKPLMNKYDSFIITEKVEYNVDTNINTYYVKQINRKEFFWIYKFLVNGFKSLFILIKEKPKIIISTGALSTVSVCLLGKMLGSKIVFIESFAKIDSPTLTGKLVYRFADQFYVQWKQMLNVYPKAIYKGGIY